MLKPAQAQWTDEVEQFLQHGDELAEDCRKVVATQCEKGAALLRSGGIESCLVQVEDTGDRAGVERVMLSHVRDFSLPAFRPGP